MSVHLHLPWHSRSAARQVKEKWKWGRLEWYILVLILGSGLVFVPGTAALRPVFRGAPYALSLLYLGWYLSKREGRELTAAGRWVLPALLLYAANIFNPLTYTPAGVATAVFHVAIAAPIFWAGSRFRDVRHFERVLWLVFGSSLAHVVVGILQAAFPYIFMPPSFSALDGVLAQQTYMGPFGVEIVRPPGLSDLPGGASFAGTITSVMGLAFALRTRDSWIRRSIGFFACGTGMFLLYLTQVRSLAVMTVLALLMFVALAFFQGRGRLVTAAGVGLSLLVVLAGLQGPGGYDPNNPYAPGARFREILDQGLFAAFMQNRGLFLERTFSEQMWQYPLGAGLGRWGMMGQYFGAGSPFEDIWVEIQLTGWLLDGGIPMWFLYGGALGAAMMYTLGLALRRVRNDVSYFAAIVLALQVAIVGSGMAGPVFNTIFGILFWLLTAGIYQVAKLERQEREAALFAARAPVPAGQMAMAGPGR